MKPGSAVLLLAMVVVLPISSRTQTPAMPQQQPLSVHPIKDGVYWTEGGAGGNTGFVVGKDGVIVFDAKMTPESAREMLAAIAKITPLRVTHVALSHSDADHVNGLSAFPKGVTIIAQENCRKEMEASKGTPKPAPPD